LTITSAAKWAIGSASKRSTSARNAAFAAARAALAAARLSLLPNIRGSQSDASNCLRSCSPPG